MITSEALAVALARHGVRIIFSQCFPMRTQHAAPKYGIRQIGFRTENAGGTMADGYARVSHIISRSWAHRAARPPRCWFRRWRRPSASIPILALVEESARILSDRNAFQELDHLRCSRAVQSGPAVRIALAGWTTTSIWRLSRRPADVRVRWFFSYRPISWAKRRCRRRPVPPNWALSSRPGRAAARADQEAAAL